ncbi:hypothetical protein ACH5RR_014279 [Cinchona calisaya]|uniref:Uncharacterized protein n=1 Tax=Cinchona calisaya TaxID=153742 RepID=A0ABD3A522_9GENT
MATLKKTCLVLVAIVLIRSVICEATDNKTIKYGDLERDGVPCNRDANEQPITRQRMEAEGGGGGAANPTKVAMRHLDQQPIKAKSFDDD